ncbi:hypothetical protein RSOL_050110 [Rhizoctonia solani AG-3 Rhs1AP]|uniref:Uncharacterized protein n=2 Tax=Rhizoctonia solani AG-3 TaxID=1086053 RepID=A0A074RP27_9AGAM|nr:hypothetical protein RSOL_050110 [Rhizoctonia solani AG-3 Rhs1AP]KEP46443.1 hypothetical protein V565_198650 [Rhizoctonia solani 123E]
MYPKAAGEATRHIPPNVPEFDGPQGIGPATTKPRGRGGSSHTSSATASATPSNAASDPTALFMAAMVPLFISLAQSMAPRPVLPVAEPTVTKDAEPTQDLADVSEPGVATSFTFLPSHTFNCVLAFKVDVGIDIISKVDALDHRDLTPDIIPEVPHEHLAGVLGVSEGKAIRFRLHCRQWAREFSRKRKEKELV